MAIGGMIVGKSFITLMVGDKTETVTESHPNYERIRDAIKVKDMDLVESLVNVAKQVSEWMHGKVNVINGQVLHDGQAVHGAIVDRILDMINEGFDAAPMLAFLDNLMQNPSKRAVDELYGFLERTSLPITDDGHFLAYKKVADNYLDFYTGTMDNSIGKVLTMPRNAVDEDKERTCSAGLHFCSLSYLKHYYSGAGHVMIVKINPRDVVAIPADYNNAKGRTCRYEVIGEHTSETEEAFKTPVFSNKVYEDLEDSSFEEYDESFGVDSGWDSESAYDTGWGLGYANAEDGSPFDTIAPDDIPAYLVEDYKVGYQDGWSEAKEDLAEQEKRSESAQKTRKDVSGGLLGYNQGRRDAAAGLAYNDNPAIHAIVTNDLAAYKKGYAKGWDSIKLAN